MHVGNLVKVKDDADTERYRGSLGIIVQWVDPVPRYGFCWRVLIGDQIRIFKGEELMVM